MGLFTAAAAVGSKILGLSAVSVTFGTVAVGLLAQTAVGLALNALTPKPRIQGAAPRGYNVTQRGSALDHQIIYGKARVGGVILYDTTTGVNNKFLHRVLGFTGHEIESFDEVYINGKQVTEWRRADNNAAVSGPSAVPNGTGLVPYTVCDKQADGSFTSCHNRYAFNSQQVRVNNLVLRFYDGSQTTADPTLIADTGGEWNVNCILRDIAYVTALFGFDQDSYPNGVPEITASIKGKKVYDPRTDTTAWSDNPALCLRDYLTNGYGLDEEAANIDDTLVEAAADACDRTANNGHPWFTCNGNFTTASTPYDTISDILTSMGGLLWYGQGKWRMKPAYWVAPTLTLTEDDLRSSIAVKTRHSRRDNYNKVRGTFRGEETNWQVTDYPDVSNAAFTAADNGQESVVDINLPFTDNSEEARRIARIALERNRQQLTVVASFGLRAFQCQVGDVVSLTNTRFGWSAKTFEVTSWSFGLTDGNDLQVQMTLREISESVFDEVDDGIVYERDNTTLASAFEVQAPGITIDSELRIINEQVAGVLIINLTGGDAGFRDYFEVEYKKSSETEWVNVGRSNERRFEVPFVSDGFYDIRARSVNSLGVRSDYTTVSNWYASLFASPPSTVQNFTGNVVGNSLHLNWDSVPDLDLSHYKIRYASETSGASYQDAIDLIVKVARPAVAITVPARTGTYFIKAVDKLGIVSEESSSFVISTNITQLENLNVVETLTENPAFSGTKTDVARVDDGGLPYITLDTSNDFDDTNGDFDDALGLFDAGGDTGALAPTGAYEFANYIDLGEKYTSRVQIDLKTLFLDYANTFDSATELFDSREGDFDGEPSQFDLTSVQPQVSYSDDDPAGSPTWSSWQNISVSDISARVLRFRVVLTTQSDKAAPAVTELSVNVDMPDRLESENDITYTGSDTVIFPIAFKATPAIGIAATLADGDRYVISAKSRTGFTITTLTGASVSTNPTTFDYVAKGYGKGLA